MKTWIAIAMLAALGCGGNANDNIEDTTDGEVTDTDEPIELGTLEQPLVVQVSNGTGDDLMGAPRDEFELSGHKGFRECTDGPASSTSCRGKTLTAPGFKNFAIAVGSAEIQGYFQTACTNLSNAGTGFSCSVSIEPVTCSGYQLCIFNQSTPRGLTDFDIRNYSEVTCNFVNETRTASWESNNYTVQRCIDYRAKYDVVGLKAKGSSSAQDAIILQMVANNIVLQTVGNGGTTGGSSDGNRWNHTSGIPGSVPPMLSSGADCRLTAYNSTGGALSFAGGSNCANN